MMNIASGSSGNATYVGSGSTHILIDAGISRKRIAEGLKRLDLKLEDLDAILITHEHSDHISSLKTLENACRIPVYTTPGTARAIRRITGMQEMDDILHDIGKEETFRIRDLEITAFGVSHDAADPVCYRLQNGNSSCAVVTDLGCFDETLVKELAGLKALMIEANHDVRMLEAGPYPYPLKLRVAGNGGHLSNEYAGRLLSELLHDQMEYVALAHLSKQNNSPDLARITVDTEIDAADNRYHAGDFRIDIADQKEGTSIYEF